MSRNRWVNVLVLCLLVFTSIYAQKEKAKISEETASLVDSLIGRMVESPHISLGGMPSENYLVMKKMSKVAGTEELLILTRDKAPEIRCYAVWALAYNANSSEVLLKVLLDHLDDTKTVAYLEGCCLMTEKVGEFMVALLTPESIDKKIPLLDSVHLAVLDSVLILTAHPLKKAKEDALKRVAPMAKYYPTIRKLAKKDSHSNALLALARYQKKADIPLILAHWIRNAFSREGLIHFYRAVSYFPHPQFMPLLKLDALSSLKNYDDYDYDETKRLAYLYKAIAAYQNQKALSLIERGLDSCRKNTKIKDFALELFFAVRPYKVPIYKELFLQFWTENQLLTEDIFEYLVKEEEQLALAAAKKSMQEITEFSSNTHKIGFSTFQFPSKILEFIRRKDEAFVRKLVEENIMKDGFKYEYFLVQEALILNMNACIERILEQIKIEKQKSSYLKFIRTLLRCKNADLTQKTLEAAMKNELYFDSKPTIGLLLERFEN